jgi:DNA-binding NtrC family response regulator
LNVFPITVPPLRSRRSDLPLLIDHLVATFCTRYGRSPKGITSEAYRAMLHYDWPGNIREMENVIKRAVILVDEGEAINVNHLFTSDAEFKKGGLLWLDEQGKLVGGLAQGPEIAEAEPRTPAPWYEAALAESNHSLEDIEQAVVLAALRRAGGNLGKAALHLGVTRAQIDYRIKKWGIDPRLLASP